MTKLSFFKNLVATAGNVILTGTKAPDATTKRADGSAVQSGDVYLDTKTGELYQASINAKHVLSWTQEINIIGPAGSPFNEFISGDAPPTPTMTRVDGGDVVTGDFYLDTKTGDLYRAEVSTIVSGITWTVVANLRGPQGAPADETRIVHCADPAKDPSSVNQTGYNPNNDQVIFQRADGDGGSQGDGWYGMVRSPFASTDQDFTVNAIGVNRQNGQPYMNINDGGTNRVIWLAIAN